MYKSEDEKQVLMIRRLKCKGCKKIHHELPDCIVPYKRYNAEVIESIVTGKATEETCPAETEKQIRWWWSIIITYFEDIMQTIKEKMGELFGEQPAFKEIVRAMVNTNNWVFDWQVCTRSPMRAE